MRRSQRASVVIKLAHISKKSMVCDPWREVSRGEEPNSDTEELSSCMSSAGVAESMLSLGLCSPAVEPDLWGVDDPDLPAASMMSSGVMRENQMIREGMRSMCLYSDSKMI